MTVSPLASKSIVTSKSSARTQRISKFTPHYMVAAWTGERCASYFCEVGRDVSANYCIGIDGDVVCNVPEERRAWTTSSSWNDHRAITVECANLPGGQFTQATWDALVRLAADVCRRYGFRLDWTGDRYGSLTAHYMFASTDCPGPWMRYQEQRFANEVNALLDGPKPKPKPTEVPKPGIDEVMNMAARQGEVRRLFNPTNGDHVYTSDPNESAELVKLGFVDEGVVGVAPRGLADVHRFCNASTGEHFLTDDLAEAKSLLSQGRNLSDGTKEGWQYEGVAFIAYADDRGAEKLHRLYRPGGYHVLTSDPNEVEALVSQGWRDEGVRFSLDAA